MIKKTLLAAYSRPRQNGVNAITLHEGDGVIQVRLTDIFIYDDFYEFAILKSSSKDIYKKLFSIKNINVETLLKEDLTIFVI